MPKLKTNRSAAKRFRVTKTGRLKKRSAGRGHMLGKKSRKRKRHLRQSSYVSNVDARKLKKILPYA
jgi:large subunit ribosomal protein L35